MVKKGKSDESGGNDIVVEIETTDCMHGLAVFPGFKI